MEPKIINFSWVNIWKLGRKWVRRLWQIENFATRETEQIDIFCFWAKFWESNVFKIILIAFFSLLGVLGLIWYTACPIWNSQNARKMAKTGVLSFWAQIGDLITGVKPYSDVDKLIPGRFLAGIYALISFFCSCLVEIRQLAPK